jgi:hypothetical protein
MTDRIIRDIRFYELRPENYSGQFDGTLGHVYKNTPDIKHIGQRIARKLNELNFASGIFDHVYVYLSPTLADNEMKIQETEMDERLKSVHYGVKPSVFNSLSDSDKDKWAKEAAFKVLYLLFRTDNSKTKMISEVEALINKYNQEIKIFYKAKETNAYKVDLNYQIKPNGNPSRLLVTFLDKKENTKRHGSINLNSHEDIYSLVDTIVVKDNTIILNPKKSNIADILGEKYYKTPLTLDVAELKN